MTRRVAFIGLDSAEWSYISRLIGEGKLPVLGAAAPGGTRVLVESGEPIGRVWETFVTGRPVAEDMHVFDRATYETFWLGAGTNRPFYVTDPALPVVSLDVPFSSLAHAAPGAQVTAWGGHNNGYPRASRPRGLLKEIDARFGPYDAIGDDRAEWHDPESLRRVTKALVAGAGHRVDVCTWLLDRVPDWELFLTVFSEPHSAGESMWQGVDPTHPLASIPAAGAAAECLEDVYRSVDAAIGELLAALPAGTVAIISSMHGSCADGKDLPANVLLPEFLYRLEFGRPFLASHGGRRWVREGFPPVVPPAGATWLSHLRTAELDARRTRLRRRLRPSRPRPWEEGPPPPETDLTPEQIGRPVKRTDAPVPAWYRPHWPAMRAFALPTFYKGRVRLNVAGRERDGRVRVEDYMRERDRIEAELRACRDPRSGEPVVDHVERWTGDPLALPDHLPDLLVHWAGKADAFDHPRLGVIGPFPYGRTGGHTTGGFALFGGPGIAPQDGGTRPAADLPPTILELLGRRATEPIEGRPIRL